MNNWISIKEDMPQPETPVLVCVDGEVKRDVYVYSMWEHTWESPSSGDWFQVQLDHCWRRLPDGTNNWKRSMERARKEFNRYTETLP